MTPPEEYKQKRPPRSRVKKRSGNYFPFFVVIAAALAAGLYFYLSRGSSNTYLDYGTAVEPSPIQTIPSLETVPAPDKIWPDNSSIDIVSPTNPAQAESNDTTIDQQGSAPLENIETGQPDKVETVEPISVSDYQKYIDSLNSFYTHLDQQPYMKDFELETSSKEHFSKLINKLLDNPPIVARETDDLFTLLKNTAHFFRILGKDNIVLLKGILDREKSSLEDMLLSFFTLTNQPQYLKKEYGLDVDSEALYDYASFLIHTMGGRLYLFRRDSTSRMAVSYYAILVIDRANKEGNSRHGIDLRPAIEALIEEIENGGKRLKYREEYLAKLYDLERQYN